MDELMRLKAAAREDGNDFLTWNDIQACIDQVNLAVHEEHERTRATPPPQHQTRNLHDSARITPEKLHALLEYRANAEWTG